MRRFLTGWLVCALLCTLCACENAAGQADLQSIQKADVRELYEPRKPMWGRPMRFWVRSSPFPPGME